MFDWRVHHGDCEEVCLKSTFEVLLGYLLAKDVVVFPKSLTPSNIESNLTGALEAYNVLTPGGVEVLDNVAASSVSICSLGVSVGIGNEHGGIEMYYSGIDLGFDDWPAPAQWVIGLVIH
ncbi:hypothetical protein BDR05DRAFT_967837 [Suillus weaverae]|nr:hypothetical protein BDR05DRAFT_967837 [Suillus weaverae]